MLSDNPREPEIVFDFPFHEDLNEAVKELPRRWFDWRRKHWRVPRAPARGQGGGGAPRPVPDLVPSPEVLAWLSDSDRWRAICTVVARDGRGHFLVRTLQGEQPSELERRDRGWRRPRVAPFSLENALLVHQLDGLRLDDLARMCARELRDGDRPAPAELTIQMGEDGEPHLTLFHVWDRTPATDFKQLSGRTPVHRPGRFFLRDAPGAWRSRPIRPWRRSSTSSSSPTPSARGGAGAGADRG